MHVEHTRFTQDLRYSQWCWWSFRSFEKSYSFETSVTIYQPRRCNISQDLKLQTEPISTWVFMISQSMIFVLRS